MCKYSFKYVCNLLRPAEMSLPQVVSIVKRFLQNKLKFVIL